MVIEGEALLNDGAAIVFFNVFLKLTTTEVGLSGLYIYFFCISNSFFNQTVKRGMVWYLNWENVRKAYKRIRTRQGKAILSLICLS